MNILNKFKRLFGIKQKPESSMRGYKIFNPGWTCRGFQYKVGKTYKETGELEICQNGFHFCKQITDCFNYYGFSPNNKVAEIVALGDIIEGTDKCCTNKIKILREITWEEVLEMSNIGKFCTGRGNTGNKNSGSWNTGEHNAGHLNSGSYNSGYHNTGNSNNGSNNTGDANKGYRNTGNRNQGSFNSGHANSGQFNSGDNNKGSHNTGDFNAGHCNTGSFNNGDFNVGDYNNASSAIGCFNTENQKLKFFDKETDMTLDQWKNSEAKRLLDYIVVLSNSSTDSNERWNNLTEEEKSTIMSIPNFDAEKFELITGIKVG